MMGLPPGPGGSRSPGELPQTLEPALDRSGCHILVVDDDLGIRSALATLLEDEGYRVEEAANGVEALACVHHQHPAVVLLDMRMTVMDGWEFAQELRARGIEIPLVVMTAARDASAWAEEIGAAAYIAKPFDVDAVIATVERFC